MMINKLSAVMLVFLCAVLQHVHSAERSSGIDAERPSASRFDEDQWQGFLRFVQETYPMKIQSSSSGVLLVHVPNEYGQLFAESGWSVSDNTNSVLELRGVESCSSVITNEAEQVYLKLELAFTSSDASALGYTLAYSTDFYGGSARPSTWGGVSVRAAKGLSFAAHFNEAPNNVGVFQVANCVLLIRAYDSKDALVTLDQLVALSGRLSNVVGPVKEESVANNTQDGLDLEVRGRGENGEWLLSWAATGAVGDYWVRMDIDAGALSIEEKGIVKAKSVPDAGATVHLYAISPDGKTWFHKELKLLASK
ncbi:MAG: hypothetical protein GXY61_08185 [Lentisphaerae bacterium]|nr:hypothetical protein [Lentisphaerota bacterium]